MVLIEGDQVNKHLPGERITANVIPVVRSEVRNRKKTPMFDVIYHLISSEHESTPFTEISFEEEDSERILEISKREDLMPLDSAFYCTIYFCYRYTRPCETLLSVATFWRCVKEAE
ncbi:MAG: hypothetical protein Ct9H90mP21_2950 [Methanobacteriota archaeon]|nr:MAG: hypothetical protein Ct9H90mP21_2950 [Euryarchaeota archaeon]